MSRRGLFIVVGAVVVIAASVYFTTYRPLAPDNVDAEEAAIAANGGFLGAEACRTCHPGEFDTWSKSRHGEHMARPSPKTMLGDFEHQTVYEFHNTRTEMLRDGDRYLMKFRGPDGKEETFEIAWVLGVARHQVYLFQEKDGRLQVLPTYWNLEESSWRDSREGPVDSGPAPIPITSHVYWRNFGRTYNRVCMECHSSQPSRRFNAETYEYESRFDPVINCEACHGPGAAHVKRWRDADKTPAANGAAASEMADLGRLKQATAVEVCAVCHAQKRLYKEQIEPGDSYYDAFMPDLWFEGRFFADGRSSTLTYHYVDYMQAMCPRRSEETLDCANSCHSPHSLAGGRGDTVSGSNQMCTRCHVQYKTGLTKHTFHAVESDGSRCVECHMPRVELSMNMSAHDHSIGSPLPELTRMYGAPNACQNCHQHDSVEWAEGFVERWYGDKPTFQAYRARMLDRAAVLSATFKGENIPVDRLVAWLDDTSRSVVERASAATFLGRASLDRDGLDALLRHRADPHPVVRFYVIDGLSAFGRNPVVIDALRAALKDVRLTVRARAYEALEVLDTEFAHGPDPDAQRVQAEHRYRFDVVRADDPRLRSQNALWHFSQNEHKAARAELERAVRLTHPVPGVRADLVQFLLSQRAYDEAEIHIKVLEEIAPGGPAALLTRGLLSMAQGKSRKAFTILDRLVKSGHRSPVALQALEAARRNLQ